MDNTTEDDIRINEDSESVGNPDNAASESAGDENRRKREETKLEEKEPEAVDRREREETKTSEKEKQEADRREREETKTPEKEKQEADRREREETKTPEKKKEAEKREDDVPSEKKEPEKKPEEKKDPDKKEDKPSGKKAEKPAGKEDEKPSATPESTPEKKPEEKKEEPAIKEEDGSEEKKDEQEKPEKKPEKGELPKTPTVGTAPDKEKIDSKEDEAGEEKKEEPKAEETGQEEGQKKQERAGEKEKEAEEAEKAKQQKAFDGERKNKTPLVNYNFLLRVEGFFDIACKSVKAFERENEFDYIQEGGVNDYVHMRRKPISKPFILQIERYVGMDTIDPLPLGMEFILPLVLFISRYQKTGSSFIPTTMKRTQFFTGCVVTKKSYGELDAEKSGLLVETVTIAYHEMITIDLERGEDSRTAWKKDSKQYAQLLAGTKETPVGWDPVKDKKTSVRGKNYKGGQKEPEVVVWNPVQDKKANIRGKGTTFKGYKQTLPDRIFWEPKKNKLKNIRGKGSAFEGQAQTKQKAQQWDVSKKEILRAKVGKDSPQTLPIKFFWNAKEDKLNNVRGRGTSFSGKIQTVAKPEQWDVKKKVAMRANVRKDITQSKPDRVIWEPKENKLKNIRGKGGSLEAYKQTKAKPEQWDLKKKITLRANLRKDFKQSQPKRVFWEGKKDKLKNIRGTGTLWKNYKQTKQKEVSWAKDHESKSAKKYDGGQTEREAINWKDGEGKASAVLYGGGQTSSEAVVWKDGKGTPSAIVYGGGQTKSGAVAWKDGKGTPSAILYGGGQTKQEAVAWKDGKGTPSAILYGGRQTKPEVRKWPPKS